MSLAGEEKTVDVRGEAASIYTGGSELSPDRPATLFVHGAGMNHSVWAPIVQQLAAIDGNLIAVDLPGHGRSTGDAITSIEGMADWLIDLVDTLGLDRVNLVGHSMGSLVALDCAARYPQRIRALGLVGTSAPMPVSQDLLDLAAANDPTAFEMLAEWGYANPDHPQLQETLRIFQSSAPGVLYTDLDACNRYKHSLERAAQIECPVAMILGEWDRLTPVRNAEFLVNALPSPEVDIITEVGHTLMAEAPESLIEALEKLL